MYIQNEKNAGIQKPALREKYSERHVLAQASSTFPLI